MTNPRLCEWTMGYPRIKAVGNAILRRSPPTIFRRLRAARMVLITHHRTSNRCVASNAEMLQSI